MNFEHIYEVLHKLRENSENFEQISKEIVSKAQENKKTIF